MKPHIARSIDRIATDARARYRRVVDAARAGSGQAAARVSRGKKPLNTLTGLGIKLSGVSHRATDKLLKQQARLLEHQLDTLALRLNKAADAGSLGEFVRTQVGLLPEQFGRLASDARASLDIVVKAGGEAQNAFRSTIAELRSAPKPAARRKPAARKSTQKASAKKTRAKSAPRAAATTARPQANPAV